MQKELVEILKALNARLDGDLISIHENVILDQPEGDFVRVLFDGVQAEPRNGHRLERRDDAAARRVLDAFTL